MCTVILVKINNKTRLLINTCIFWQNEDQSQVMKELEIELKIVTQCVYSVSYNSFLWKKVFNN